MLSVSPVACIPGGRHAHNKAEFVDGLFGAMIVDPPDGVPDPINERFEVGADFDQVLFVGDWSHEKWEDNEQKYLGRQGEYPGYDRDMAMQSQDPTLPHLPDYPWPTHSVILNGRGQFPCEGRYVSEADCRIIREWGWLWWEDQSQPKPEPNPERPNFCRGAAAPHVLCSPRTHCYCLLRHTVGDFCWVCPRSARLTLYGLVVGVAGCGAQVSATPCDHRMSATAESRPPPS